MKRQARLSLQGRLVRLVTWAVLLALLATVAAVAIFEVTTFRPRALDNAKTQANLVAEIIVPALEFDDARTAGKLMTILHHAAAIDTAGVYRADGTLLAGYVSAPGVAAPPATPPAAGERVAGRKISVSLPVNSGGVEIGRVWLQAELPGWGDRIRQYGPLLVLVALAAVVLSIAISLATRQQITGPLQALSDTVKRVGQSRDLRLRVAEADSGEIGDLARAFNRMLATLDDHDRQVSEHENRLTGQNRGLADMARAQTEQPEDADVQSRRLTEILSDALNVERSGIWLFSPDGAGLECRDLFVRATHQHTAGLVLPTARFPVYLAALGAERVIAAADVQTDPRTAEFRQDYAMPHGIGAMLDVPVRWRGRLAGVLCLEHVGPARQWQLDEVSFAISAADRVALFLEAGEASRAAAELRDSEERYRNLIEEARDAIFTLARDGTILALNQAVEKITGWKRELWIGRNFTEPLRPEDRAKARALFAEVVQGGHPPSFELEIRSRKGVMIGMEFAISPRYQNGEVVGLLGVGRDVTERKQAAEAQAELEDKLRQAQKMEAIGNLAGGIAHDFNNILTAIIGNAQLAVLELADGHGAREYLGSALAASQRAKELVNQILTFSRRQEQKRVPTSLGGVVRDSLKLMRSVLPSTIEICSTLPDDLPPVLANVTQVHQIVVNLATNAAHAMEATGGQLGITVDEVTVDLEMIRQRPQLRSGRFVRLAIADTGIGMSEADLQRIFEPFFTTKETGKGTGLGLAVVHGIVQQHDAVIVVYSEPGAGTCFQIFFPILEVAAGATTAEVPPAAAPGTPGGGRCVMVVDDDELVLAVAAKLLNRAGYRVRSYGDPALALEAFRAAPKDIDLVVTDLTMPRLKGTQLAAEIHRLNPATPVILTTGFGGGLDPGVFQRAGLHGPLQKPFTSEELFATVTRALEPPA